MQISFDPKHNIAYLRLQERTPQVETIRISDSVNIDLAPDGTVYGIELLNANEQLRGTDHGRLVVLNEETGKPREISLVD